MISKILVLATTAVLWCSIQARGQDVPEVNGHLAGCVDSHGNTVSCDSGSSSGSDNGGIIFGLLRLLAPPHSSASSAELKAARERAAEQKRLEGLEREQKIEDEREQKERELEQQRFNQQVRALAGELKGVGGNTDFFGLKGVSPDQASAMINDTAPDVNRRDVSTASKQLTCANDISNYILGHVSRIVSGTGTAADMDEIKYLSGEAANALQGDPVGVQCNSSGALKFTKAPDLKTLTPAYKTALGNLVRDSGTLYETDQQANTVRQKVDNASQSVDDAKKQESALLPQAEQLLNSQRSQSAAQPHRSTGDSDVDKAYAEQKDWQAKDEEKIKQIYEQQEKLQQQQIDALGLLRKAEAELNAINSQKVGETKTLTEDAKQVGALESGNVPQESGNSPQQ